MKVQERFILTAPFKDEDGVLSEIDSLSGKPNMIMTPRVASQDSISKKTDAWWTSKDIAPDLEAFGATTYKETIQSHAEATREANAEFNEDFRLPLSDSDSDSDKESSEIDTLLPSQQAFELGALPVLQTPVVDPHTPKIIARYIYPPEHRLVATPPKLPPRRDQPPQSSVFSSLLSLLFSCIIDSEPAIIEYTPQQIRQGISEACVEAQMIEYEAQTFIGSGDGCLPKKFVSVIALLHVGKIDQRRAVPITAKPKRVRELLKDNGMYDSAEDVYRKEIKGALKSLGKLTRA
jgi:hypothetical protein